MPAALLKDAMGCKAGTVGVGFERRCDGLFGLAGWSDCLYTQGDDLDLAPRVGIAVHPLVKLVEAGQGPFAPIYLQFKALAVVSQVGGTREHGTRSVCGEGLSGFGFEFLEDGGDSGVVGCKHDGARELTAQIRVEDAEGRERARCC